MEKKTNTNAFKVKALRPVIKEWNSIISDHWKVEEDTCGCVIVKSNDESVLSGYKGIHGILLTKISEVANEYGWTFGIHYTQTDGIYVLVS